MDELRPDDEHNRALRALVSTKGLQPVTHDEPYDLVAIGAGTAGLVAVWGATALGASTALIERNLMGGDCLVTGCVPSKALLHAGMLAHEARRAGAFGIELGAIEVDFPAVMAQMRRTRADIGNDDSVEAFESRGVRVIGGSARFTGPQSLEVDGRAVRFKRAVIATGGRPLLPPIPGIQSVEVMTNETLFELTERPQHLLIVGGGAIGSEMAQAMCRLGTRVTLVQRAASLVPADDPEAGSVLAEVLQEEGVDVRLSATVERLAPGEGTAVRATINSGGNTETVEASHVLVATGRRPNVEGLDLEAAGVKYGEQGILVDARMRTSNRRVMAAGDVCAVRKFTHVAIAQAEYATLNALLPVRLNADKRPIPHVTYTDPEVAHVGLSWAELQHIPHDSYRVELHVADRTVIEGERRGFAKVHTKKGSDKILAATVVARHGGEVIPEFGLAIRNKLGLARIADSVHAYPTRSELAFRVAYEYNSARLTPGVKRVIGWLLALLR